MSKKYTTNFLEDTNGSTGSANQVLVSTASGVDWVDGSGSGIIGGPYLPVANPTFTGTLTGPVGSFSSYVYAGGAIRVPYAGSTKMPMIVLNGATTYGLFHTEASSDLFTFDFGGVSKQTFNQNGNVTFVGDLTVSGGDIILGSTGRIQGVDTVSAGTDAANKTYVDTKVASVGGSTTIASTGGTTPVISANVAAVSSGSSVLATGDQIQTAINTALVGVLSYQGTWNASTNAPTLASGVGTAGYYYIVSVAGSTNLDGITSWAVGDWAVFSDLATDAWQKIDNTQVGNVTGSGSSGQVAYWNSSSNIISSGNMTFNGANLGVSGVMSAFGGNSTEWNTAYDNSVTAINDSGTSTTTITLTQQDGGTLSTSFSNPQGTGNVTTGGFTSGRVPFANSSVNLDNSANLTFDGTNLTVGGNITANGSVYVNWDDTSSNIYMQDSDQGARTIHCNSNYIGFLNQAGSWAFGVDDTGNTNNWYSSTIAGTLTVVGSINFNGSLNSTGNIILSTASAGANIEMYTNGNIYYDAVSHNFRDSDASPTYFNITASQVNSFVSLAMNNYKITTLATPTSAADAATKAYVDAHGGGLGPFLPVANPTFTGTLTGPAATITTVTGALVGNATTATNVAYSGLTGTVPTWNQNTTGNAATATLAANSTLAGGLAINTSGTNNVANQIVRTEANGYVNFGWINSASGATTSTITRITASNDAYLRYVTPATFRSQVIAPYFAPIVTGGYLPLTGGTMTGQINAQTINFDGIVNSSAAGGLIGRNHAYDTLELKGYGSEMMIGSQGTHLHVNYRTCNNGAANSTPTDWFWRAGSSTSFSNHSFGTVTATGLKVNTFSNNAGNLIFSAGNTTTGASRTLNLRTSGQTGDPSQANNSNSTGITWGQRTDNTPYYIIYPNLENWSSSGNYSKLTLAWHTGIKIGASTSYGGTRFYSNSPDVAGAAVILNVGVGNSNIGVVNNLTVGGQATGPAPTTTTSYANKAYVDAHGGGVGPFLPIANPTFTGTLTGPTATITGNIKAGSLSDDTFTRFTNPDGASYVTQTSSVTGAIAITLPLWANPMMRMTIQIYEYSTNESFTVSCGGHNSGTSWYNTFAYIVGNPSKDRRFTIRFGRVASSGLPIVYIGELASTWSYPQVFVTDVQVGFAGYSASWASGWNIGFETGAFENPTGTTIYNSQVGYALSTNTASTSVLRDGSGNFAAGTITAALSGNATTASSAAQVTIDYNNNSNANYQMLWGSGNNVYATAGVTVQPYTNTITATTFSGALSGNAATVTNGVYTIGNQSISGTKTFTSRSAFTATQYPLEVYGIGSTASSSAVGLGVYGSSTAGAIMHFHRPGAYAVNFGLDSDNILRIGGWSASANRWSLDMSGNNAIAGDLTVSGGDITLGGTGRIQGVDTVSASTDAANKAYVDAHVTPAGTYLPLAGGTMTGALVNKRINMNRSAGAGGQLWYSSSYTSWQNYMNPGGAGAGYSATITAPTGTYVTSWALRSFIEGASGYGWTWEQGTASTTTPSIVAELSSSSGNFKTIGNIYASGGNSTQWNTHTSNAGTVTSVRAVTNGTSLGTSNIITTSGTMTLPWQGTSAQYVNGAGNLTTFPTIPQGDITAVYSGNGLTGGGTSGGVTLDVGQGDGISVTADAVAVNSTVVRTTGAQSIAGIKTFTSSPIVPTVANNDDSQNAVNSEWVVNNFSNNQGDITGVTAGTGLTGGGTSGTVTLNVIGGDGITANANSIDLDNTVVRTSGAQTVAGLKSFTSAIITNSISTRDKIRVWTTAPYNIGMGSNYTYGGLGNEYAMTFQMDNNSNRGFWWGDQSHTNAQGAMSLTTNGYLTVASAMRLAYGESDTTTPGGTYKLDVGGNTLINGVEVIRTSTGVGDMYLGNYATANHFRFHTNNSATYFDMNCGTINWRDGGSTRYYFYPSTANMTVNGTITQNSDSRVKENVVEIGDCISKVQAMRGVYYNRTDFNTEVTKVGVIAQEVEAVLPELILEAPDTGLKSVAYAELTAVLINAIKEQQEIIENLTTRIEQLEN